MSIIDRIRAWSKRRREAWPNAARELGGTHHPQSRWWRNDEHILANVDGATVKLDSYTVSTGKSSATYTRVVAPFVYGPGPKMKVAKRGVFATIGTALGMDDHALGDPVFDDAYVVRGNHAAVLRRLWTPQTRARMMADAVADTTVTADAEKVTMIGGGRWVDPVPMVEAMRLVGELAARDIYGETVLRTLGPVTHDPWPRVALDTGVRVVIGAEARDGALVMVARADVAADAFDVVDGKLASDRVLPQAAHVHLARAGTATFADGALAWRDLELDAERLRAGAALLGALAAGGALYR